MFSTTTFIYTIIVVGLSTYLIVFNLNNLVIQGAKSYQLLRDQLVKEMKEAKDKKDFWSTKGKKFDVFRPQHEKAHPSEWWIMVFLFRALAVKVAQMLHLSKYCFGSDDAESERSSSISSASSVSSRTNDYRRSSWSVDSLSSHETLPTLKSEDARQAKSRVADDTHPIEVPNDVIHTNDHTSAEFTGLPGGEKGRSSPAINSPTSLNNENTPKDRKHSISYQPPPPKPKHRTMAGRTLSRIFRRKKAKAHPDTTPV